MRTRLVDVAADDLAEGVLSVLEAADVLGIDVADAYRLIFAGRLTAVRGQDGRFLVRSRDLPMTAPTR